MRLNLRKNATSLHTYCTYWSTCCRGMLWVRVLQVSGNIAWASSLRHVHHNHLDAGELLERLKAHLTWRENLYTATRLGEHRVWASVKRGGRRTKVTIDTDYCSGVNKLSLYIYNIKNTQRTRSKLLKKIWHFGMNAIFPIDTLHLHACKKKT